jgi:hypothetical protein
MPRQRASGRRGGRVWISDGGHRRRHRGCGPGSLLRGASGSPRASWDGDPEAPWRLVYQSRSGSPSDSLAGAGHPRRPRGGGCVPTRQPTDGVVVVPLGFLTDHVEVLWDLDTQASRRAYEHGLIVRAGGRRSAPTPPSSTRSPTCSPTTSTGGPDPDAEVGGRHTCSHHRLVRRNLLSPRATDSLRAPRPSDPAPPSTPAAQEGTHDLPRHPPAAPAPKRRDPPPRRRTPPRSRRPRAPALRRRRADAAAADLVDARRRAALAGVV